MTEYSDSPFSFTRIARDELFAGRETLVKLLEANIAANESTIVYGQRRIGKSSLISEACRIHKLKHKSHLFIELDMATCSNSDQFISIISHKLEELIKKHEPLKNRFTNITNFISSIKPVAKINSITGEPEYSFDFSGTQTQIKKSLEDIFDLIDSIALNHKLTIILDEFQSILDWDNSSKIQWLIRSRIQSRGNVGYIFSGSSQKLISKLFQQSKGAFYKSSLLLHLDNKIEEGVFSKWIKKRFKKGGKEVSNELIFEILKRTKSHPYYTQKLCYYMTHLANNKNIEIQDLRNGIQMILDLENPLYLERLDHLSKNALKLILALAKLEPGEKLFSQYTLKKYSLPAIASTQSSLKQLESENTPLIYKVDKDYVFEDPFFKIWLDLASIRA